MQHPAADTDGPLTYGCLAAHVGSVHVHAHVALQLHTSRFKRERGRLAGQGTPGANRSFLSSSNRDSLTG